VAEKLPVILFVLLEDNTGLIIHVGGLAQADTVQPQSRVI
jgi:hypothetical protein